MRQKLIRNHKTEFGASLLLLSWLTASMVLLRERASGAMMDDWVANGRNRIDEALSGLVAVDALYEAATAA